MSLEEQVSLHDASPAPSSQLSLDLEDGEKVAISFNEAFAIKFLQFV